MEHNTEDNMVDSTDTDEDSMVVLPAAHSYTKVPDSQSYIQVVVVIDTMGY